MPGIPLAATISELRKEITLAIAQSQDKELKFRLGPIELELNVQLEKSEQIGGGIKVWVLSLGASDKVSSAEIHRVKLSLQPQSDSGGDVEVSRRK